MLSRKLSIPGICILYLLIISLYLTGCSGPAENNTAGTTESGASSPTGETTPDSKTEGTIPSGSESTMSSSVETSTMLEAEPVFKVERERKYINVDWKPTVYEKKVQPYTISKDLSNVQNLNQFGSFTPGQKQALTGNGFVVIPSEDEQLYYTYERNQYLKIPSFITTDSVLQIYHIFFDYSLRTLESEKLIGAAEQMTVSMLDKSIALYNRLKNPEVKNAALKNAAYFAVAQKALEKPLPANLPVEAENLAESEFEYISKQEGFSRSPIFDFDLDYSQYRPRGHYTRNHDFERYFKVMMWYGQAPFPLISNKGTLDIDDAIRALLMTYTIFLNTQDSHDAELWEKIYDPTAFYVGISDDISIYQLKDILIKVYSEKPDPEAFANKDYLAGLFNEIKKLPPPKIQAAWTSVNTPVGLQFRFMGQRYIPDSEILQRVVEPIKRPFPKGLDIMGALGSGRAYDILIDTYHEDKKWDDYISEFTKVKDEFSKISERKWRSNMYFGWLWVLKSFTSPFKSGYPSFMTNSAWRDKSLSTALGSWTELRHDTILYGKQSGAECGGGEEEAPPVIKGYVEPNIEVYEKLLWLTRYSRVNLTERGILPKEMEYKMQSFEDLLDFLTDCSVKELGNEELSREEYDQLLIYGGMLESLTLSLAGGEILSDTDRNMAVVADVHTVPGWYLEEAVGPAAHIYVVVPIGGKLYLTRGSVFSYYEFESDLRLTDEEWQKILQDGRQPGQPEWVNSFTNHEKKEEIPEPANPYTGGPYSSGC